MRYIVLADHGAYTAGQVLDLNDREEVATLIRTTGVSVLAVSETAPEPEPEPEVVSAPRAPARKRKAR